MNRFDVVLTLRFIRKIDYIFCLYRTTVLVLLGILMTMIYELLIQFLKLFYLDSIAILQSTVIKFPRINALSVCQVV